MSRVGENRKQLEIISDNLERIDNELYTEFAQVCGCSDNDYFEYIFQMDDREEVNNA